MQALNSKIHTTGLHTAAIEDQVGKQSDENEGQGPIVISGHWVCWWLTTLSGSRQ